jgi:uncharacterized protein YbjT (DUF2867 family)
MSNQDNRRVFLAGATGAIGVPLLALLQRRGHEVAGLTRSAEKAGALEADGVAPIVCDVFDREALIAAVSDFGPAIVIHELTDLPDEFERLPDFLAANSRIRTEGTRNLLDAAKAAGAQRFLAQSVAWKLPGAGGEAVAEHEDMVLGIGGVVLRYGQFYGPRTYHENDQPGDPKIHVEQAARRTAELIDAPSGIFVIADGLPEEPAW